MERENSYNLITHGSIWKGIFSLFFPIMLGIFFQQLYNTVDSIIVGQLVGKEALAAVGGGASQIISLIIGFFMGVSTGAGVIVSQHYGNGDIEKTRKSIYTALFTSIAMSLVVTSVGIISSPVLLRAIATPDDIFSLSRSYLTIYFGGSATMIIYSMVTGIFRAIGDSRRPLYCLVFGSVLNIVLDLLFIGSFGMGVAGAAIATVLSQAACCIVSIVLLRCTHHDVGFHLRGISFDASECAEMLKIGIPCGIQAMMYTISKLFMMAGINAFGTDTVAAWAVYTKLDALYWTVLSSFSMALTTFIGQNFGAGNRDRCRKAVMEIVIVSSIYTFFMTFLYIFCGDLLYMLFSRDEKVIEIGMGIIMVFAPYLIIYLPIEILTGALQGAGKIVVTTFSSIVGICLFRIIWMYTGARLFPTIEGLLAIYPITWVLNSALLIAYYFSYRWLDAEDLDIRRFFKRWILVFFP